MKLHLFNPEHDIALAAHLANFTAPHAARQLRYDLGFLPALWAEESDMVLVDDVEVARKAYKHCMQSAGAFSPVVRERAERLFAPFRQHACYEQATALEPWGWDLALSAVLRRGGCPERLLPSAAQLQAVRQLSHRRLTARLLPGLRMEGTVGEAFECPTIDDIAPLVARYGRMVLKAPWSSSGRGLRFISTDTPLEGSQLAGWLRHVIDAQGCVMAEPLYNKVKDFGMEFMAHPDGSISYEGLSLFHTANGAYTGNVVATESAKLEMISNYITVGLLIDIKEKICHLLAETIKGEYQGPLGVDMMVVAATSPSQVRQEGALLHPCVEVNLRRTMGHVAIALNRLCNPQDDDEIRRIMRIDYNGNNYQLKILKQ